MSRQKRINEILEAYKEGYEQGKYDGTIESRKKMSESNLKDIISRIQQAKNEALKNDIRANTVILNNKKFGRIKPFHTSYGYFPPMICGLELNLSNDLPEGYDFLVYESPVTETERLLFNAEKETVRECLKILNDIGGCGATEDYFKGWDAAIDGAYKAISDKYGVTAFDEENEE